MVARDPASLRAAALPNFLVGPYTKPPIALGAAVPGYSVLPTPARDVIFNKDNLGGSTIAERNLDRFTIAIGLIWFITILGLGLLARFAG